MSLCYRNGAFYSVHPLLAAKVVRSALAVGFLFVAGTAGVHAATPAPPPPFVDSFEGTEIYTPFWGISFEYGAVGLSAEKAYAGSHSLKFASASGGQRNMNAVHQYAHPTKGSVSIAFFDAAPGQETLYEQVILANSTNASDSVVVGTQDFDANCYMATAGNGKLGPNANCGFYPQLSTTAVKRTLGWHVFTITYGASVVSISIDGSVVFSAPLNYQFDTIYLRVSGPYWRPNTVAYFDNVSFTPLSF
jgi:hypothetical protein